MDAVNEELLRMRIEDMYSTMMQMHMTFAADYKECYDLLLQSREQYATLLHSHR